MMARAYLLQSRGKYPEKPWAEWANVSVSLRRSKPLKNGVAGDGFRYEYRVLLLEFAP